MDQHVAQQVGTFCPCPEGLSFKSCGQKTRSVVMAWTLGYHRDCRVFFWMDTRDSLVALDKALTCVKSCYFCNKFSNACWETLWPHTTRLWVRVLLPSMGRLDVPHMITSSRYSDFFKNRRSTCIVSILFMAWITELGGPPLPCSLVQMCSMVHSEWVCAQRYPGRHVPCTRFSRHRVNLISISSFGK